MNVRRYLLISGNVQGVSFRKYTKQVADELRVTGWVRNLASGEVYACLEGPPDGVEALITWCHQGPVRASVVAVAVIEGIYLNEFSSFTIQPDLQGITAIGSTTESVAA